MRYNLCRLLLLLLILAPKAFLSAQEGRPRVGVLAIENQTETDIHDALAETVRQTVLLTLELLNRYEVVDTAGEPSGDLSTTAAALPADTLLFGDVSLNTTGQVVLSLSVFDRQEDRIVLAEEGTAASLLDVFETADRLVEGVLGSFSGVRVGFGSIRLDIAGSGTYRVSLDRTVIGENVRSVERILTGQYPLRVEQSILGRWTPVLEREIQVEDGATLNVAVSLRSEEEIRRARLDESSRELDRQLRAPPGPGETEALDRTLAAYMTAGPEPRMAEWFRHRVELAREYRRILDYSYFDASAPTFGPDIHRQLLPTSYALHETVPDEAFSEEEWAALRASMHRNVATFYGVMLLAADYQTILGNIESQTLPYDVLFQLSEDGLSVLEDRSHRPYQERLVATSMARDYARAVERQRPVWQIAAATIGLAGISASGVIFGLGMPQDRISDGDTAYAAYEATTDPDEAVRLREETTSHYDAANELFLMGGVSGAAGVTLLSTGIISRIRSVRRPDRIREGYLGEIGSDRLEAALAFFEDDGDFLVLVRGSRSARIEGGRVLQIGSRAPTVTDGPAIERAIPTGTPVVWSTGPLDPLPYSVEHVVHPGRNVIYLR
jgi:TolB-like protein